MIKFVEWIIFWQLLSGKVSLSLCCSEHAVRKVIFTDYDKTVRPVMEQSTQTNVRVGTEIYSILFVDEQEESIELIIMTSLTWMDEFLRWNISQFDCSYIRTLARHVWQPDYVFMNVLSCASIVPKEIQYLSISNNGTIYMELFTHATLRCSMDVEKFPFDNQTCRITAALWSYEGATTYLSMPVQPSLEMVNNGVSGFETISFDGNMYYSFDDTTNMTFSDIKYTLGLKRLPDYYILMLIVPSFLLTSLCIIGIFMPNSSLGERNEKMTLGLTTLLSMAMILTITADAMPKSAGLPLLGYYILYEIIVCSMSTIFSMAVIFLHERSHTQEWNPPKVILWIENIKHPWHYMKRKRSIAEQTTNTILVKTSKSEQERNQIRGSSSFATTSLSAMESRDIIEYLRKITQHFEHHKSKKEMRKIWRIAFETIDLLLLFIFLIANCVLTYCMVLNK